MDNELTIKSLLPVKSNQLEIGKTYIGIDFGTSTTVVSLAVFDVKSQSIETKSIPLDQLLEDGTRYTSEKIDTVIAWYNNQILVGRGAADLKYQLRRGKNIWYSFKMELGEDLGAKYYDSELARKSPFNIRNPKDAARVFFMYLKILITRFCNQNGYSSDIEYAVSIPASFEANQRRDLMDVLIANGMNVENQSFIDEPNAAFLSYIQTRSKSKYPLLINPNYNPKILVFDFGGGTCDISILEVGKNIDGFYSKNLSISRFTQLGGDDIDRYIAYHYLLPRFLQANNYEMSDFRTQEKKYMATQLYKVAERLKVLICKNLAVMMNDFIVPDIKNSPTMTKIEVPILIETSKGILYQDSFMLSNAELTAAMGVFTQKTQLPTKVKGEDDYNTIFMPIESSIRKANISLNELDYVLLIGGSSKSPYIQETLKNYFEDSELLIPQDLQTHVSQGAAIHSLLINGFGRCVIRPITSEPILVITADETPTILVPAGTNIPTESIQINNLVTSREGQKVVELPVCVGNTRKMLFNLKIIGEKSFPINTPIQLTLRINSDKLLVIEQAICMDVSCKVEPINPFANKELTTEERIVLVAERQVNLEAEQNSGIPTKHSLEMLRKAYIDIGNSFFAAETYERQIELYPSLDNYNAIGVLYANSGNAEKAISFFEKALLHNPNDKCVMRNLGISLKNKEPQRAKELFQKILESDPNDPITLIELGRFDKQEKNAVEAQRKFIAAYNGLLHKWQMKTISKAECSWLIWVANELGHNDVAQEVRTSQSKSINTYYNIENLSKSKTNQIEKL